MEQLGVKPVGWVHTTSLKQRQLAHFPNMCAQHPGYDILVAFNESLGIKHQNESTAPAAMSITQLLKFNSIMHQWTTTGSMSSPSQVCDNAEDASSNLHWPNATHTHTHTQTEIH